MKFDSFIPFIGYQHKQTLHSVHMDSRLCGDPVRAALFYSSQWHGKWISSVMAQFTMFLRYGVIFLVIGNSSAFAIERETPIPEGVWQTEVQVQWVPEYEEAFGGSQKRVPLKNLLIREQLYRERLKGSISRKENITEFKFEYGLNSDWVLGLYLPYVQKSQKSTLAVTVAEDDPHYDTVQRIKQSLASNEISGLGDLALKAGYDMHYSNTLHTRGGAILELPTGNTETARGIYTSALGEQQVDLTGFLHFTWYPQSTRLRSGVRISATNQLKGTRETLAGKEVEYFGGNILDLRYNWIYELNKGLVAIELQRTQGEESTLGGEGQDNAFYMNRYHVEIGYGNLTELESSTTVRPYQIRISYTAPVRIDEPTVIHEGQNVPALTTWQLTWLTYF
ncbi:hypothetical protein WDW89_07320 [Deltaproteobacteria bacterium TL4]